ncbi:MAG: hypothetical protein ABIH90_00245 [Candidatus Aenigmatarchaeota archaeon]
MKRDPIAILEQMFEALERGKPFTLNELSHETGIHCITLKRYIRLVKIVRREPELEIIRTRHSVIVRMQKPASSRREEDI